MDLGALSHDLVLDPHHDVLYVALDLIGEVRVFEADRPATPDSLVVPPQLLSTLLFPDHYPQALASLREERAARLALQGESQRAEEELRAQASGGGMLGLLGAAEWGLIGLAEFELCNGFQGAVSVCAV